MTSTIGNIAASQGLGVQSSTLAQRVTQAVKQASDSTGVEFSYLLNNATQESGLNPTAKAKTSSATGLFQFVEQTWLRMVKAYGEKYGLGDVADRITIGSDGVARVSDKQSKKEILALRKDPEVSACMAAELTNENKESLKSEVGGKIGATELYLAHFLGAGGAADFIEKMRANPNAKAADVVPSAASANKSVFYDKCGQPRTLAQVYRRFAERFDQGTDQADVQVASAASATSGTAMLSMAGYRPFSVSQTGLASTSNYASPRTSRFQPDTAMSSTFAAMMISQVDLGDLSMSSTSAMTATNDDEQKKKAALSLLSAIG